MDKTVRPLEKTIRRYCLNKIGYEPDLDNPRTYTDKINWLKLHDQMPEQATCCNKLAARDYVMDKYGPGLLLSIYGVGTCFDDLRPKWPAVVKCNHDSGSASIVHNSEQWEAARKRIDKRLARTYALGNGEWGYWHIQPLCFVEEYYPGGAVDYKFHCCEGRVKWVQIVKGRADGHPAECMTDVEGNWLPLHFNYRNRLLTKTPELPKTWKRMIRVAEKLADGFRYVRVDLYTHENDIRFGELTFWPLAGVCRTKDSYAFGQMLDFDMGYKRPAIVC